MSENLPKAESQKERWLKYGANVVAASVVVVLLAVFVTWLAQEFNRRVDTTTAGLYSLKPQTVNIIRDNKQSIRIVSLYTRTRPDGATDETAIDYVQPVADLLEEYERKGRNIKVEIVDPVSQPTKVDQLIDEVTRRYGGEVQKYKAVVDEYPAIYEQISKLANEESKQVASLPLDNITDQDLGQTLLLTIATVQGWPQFLEKTKDGIERRLKQKPPDYKGAVRSIEEGVSTMSRMLSQIIEDFGRSKENAKVPEPIRKYMAESLPRYEQMKKLSDDLDKRIKELGELKLDELRQSLRARDAILVMGENEMRVIPRDKVWQASNARDFGREGEPRPRFAGEQQVTSAILSLTAGSKPKVVFLRPGGAPLATPGMIPFREPGPLALIAERLREYNFEVLEKDLSGMWAMQSQMQGMPSAPEPSDEQIKDAIWIVINIPAGRSPMGMPPPSSIGPKLAEHMKAGGSAMVLSVPNVDPLAEVLGEWGVKLRTDVVAVHEPVKAPAGRPSDLIEDALRIPYLFVINDYGNHLLARPLKSLDSLLVPLLVVQTEPKAGYQATGFLPVPQSLKTWGETNLTSLQSREAVQYDPPKPGSIEGDLPPPLHGGAIVEKDGGGRLVVIGSLQFVFEDMLQLYDPDRARQGVYVSRFPGNAELFLNSVFWLAKMEPMIAISPSALEVSRVREIKPAVLNTWRIGVLLVGLPLAVVAAGVFVYFARRD